MGMLLLKQPNGDYALFSSIQDTFVLWDATRDEVLDFIAQKAAKRDRAFWETRLDQLDSQGYYPCSGPRLSWKEAVEEHNTNSHEFDQIPLVCPSKLEGVDCTSPTCPVCGPSKRIQVVKPLPEESQLDYSARFDEAGVGEGESCSTQQWEPPKGHRYELERVRGRHVFAWQVSPSPRSQYLLCVVCKKAYHILFPHNQEKNHASNSPD